LKKSRSPKSSPSGILVRFERHRRIIVAFEVVGHAGFAAAGRDIVCAGVSALVQATTHGLRQHCHQQAAVTDSDARYSLRLTGPASACSQALLATMLSGLQAIARSHPGYIRVQANRSIPKSA
jgi:uncharacterized protein